MAVPRTTVGTSEALTAKRERLTFYTFALVGAVFLVVAHVLVAAGSGVLFGSPLLVDTDAYMWMNRVNHLVSDGGWFDKVYPRIDPPQGHIQHWTRPTDVILLVGGWAAGLFVGFDRGLYFWGVTFPPLMHILAYVVLLKAAVELVHQGILPRGRLAVASLVILSQVAIYQPFMAGRPDHHAPLALAFAVHILLWLRLVGDGTGRVRTGIALGVVNAVALWINPEALIYMAISMAGLSALWIVAPGRFRRGTLGAYGLALGAGVAVAALLEWGPGFGSARWMDVLSLPHVVLFGLVALYWILLDLNPAGAPLVRRVVFVGGGGIGTLALTLAFFPEFVADPLAATDPIYRATRLERIEELQSVWSLGHTPAASLGYTILFVGTPIMGLAMATIALVRARSGAHRTIAASIFLLLACYLLLALDQRRWLDYLAIAGSLPASVLVGRAIDTLEARNQGHRVRLLRMGLLLALITGPALLGMGLKAFDHVPGPTPRADDLVEAWWTSATNIRETPAGMAPECDDTKIVENLASPVWSPAPTLIMAHSDRGPALLYGTPHSVLSIPNHRPQPGYHFTRQVMNSTDMRAAGEALQERGVGAVVLCLSDVTSGFWGAGAESVAERLVRGEQLPGYARAFEQGGVRIFVAVSLEDTPQPETR